MNIVKISIGQRDLIEQCVSILDIATLTDKEPLESRGFQYRQFDARYWCNASAVGVLSSDCGLYALLINDRVVSTVQVKTKKVFALATKKGYERNGYAKALIRHLEQEVGDLTIDAYWHNAVSRGLFESLGYAPISVTYKKAIK